MNYGYVYKTTNLVNNKIYIGQKNGKFNSNYLGSGLLIRRVIDKEGLHNFKLEVIVYAENKEKLDELERKYIAEYRQLFGRENLYNLTDGGDGGSAGLSIPRTSEWIENIRIGNIGKHQHLYGRKYKLETIEKMRESAPKTHSVEHNLNISKAMKGKKLQLGKYWKLSSKACKNIAIAQRNRREKERLLKIGAKI